MESQRTEDPSLGRGVSVMSVMNRALAGNAVDGTELDRGVTESKDVAITSRIKKSGEKVKVGVRGVVGVQIADC